MTAVPRYSSIRWMAMNLTLTGFPNISHQTSSSRERSEAMEREVSQAA